MPNAFATGRNAKKAVLCVTTSLMDGRLDDRELEGVIAHEMSHVAHKDVAVMTIASFLGIIAGLLVGLIESYTTQFLNPGLIDIVVFGLLLLTLAVRPTGLIAEKREENV